MTQPTDWLALTGIPYNPQKQWHINEWHEIRNTINRSGRISYDHCLAIIDKHTVRGTNQERRGSKKMIWYLVNQIHCLKYV